MRTKAMVDTIRRIALTSQLYDDVFNVDMTVALMCLSPALLDTPGLYLEVTLKYIEIMLISLNLICTSILHGCECYLNCCKYNFSQNGTHIHVISHDYTFTKHERSQPCNFKVYSVQLHIAMQNLLLYEFYVVLENSHTIVEKRSFL